MKSASNMAAAVAALALLIAIPASASAQNWSPVLWPPHPGTVKKLFNFSPWVPELSAAGSNPTGPLLRDSNGALYGTASGGGDYYYGTVFKLTPPAAGQTEWTAAVLYSFTGGIDGGSPNSGLVMDASGALYGTTSTGGWYTNDGVVYKLTPPAPGETNWTQTVLYRFYFDPWSGVPSDGANPHGALVMDQNGVLYGTTILGGAQYDGVSYIGYGTVFKLEPVDPARTDWHETVIYRFINRADGVNPEELTLDGAGNLYGTTLNGGVSTCTDIYNTVLGCGTIFKLNRPGPGQSTWTKTMLWNFIGRPDGAWPQGKLLLGPAGVVYGTTIVGGSGLCTDVSDNLTGCGTVFKLTPPAPGQTSWTQTLIRDFTGPDGAFPQGGVIADAGGALYGTTTSNSSDFIGQGVLFALIPPPPGQTIWAEAIIYYFDGASSGDTTIGELLLAPNGRFYGVAYQGGTGLGGTVYEFTP